MHRVISPSFAEVPIVITPSIAGTIGLEESVLLSFLTHWGHYHPDQRWTIEQTELTHYLPFWDLLDLQRIIRSAESKGVLAVYSPPLSESKRLEFSLQPQVTVPDVKKSPTRTPGKTTIAENWRPSERAVEYLTAMYRIPSQFIVDNISPFVIYWRDRADKRDAWDSVFIERIITCWEAQNTNALPKKPRPMTRTWLPDKDTLSTLHARNIPKEFIEDAINEFRIYWVERGEAHQTWNAKFIYHVGRQWNYYSGLDKHKPHPLPTNWQPNEDVYRVLQLAYIEKQFAVQCLPQFKLYWSENKSAKMSWSTIFLQYVKSEWMRTKNATARDKKTSFEELSDRHWG